MKKSTIMVIGSGGREAAIIHTLLRQNPDCHILAAPGNAGLTLWDRVTVLPHINSMETWPARAFVQKPVLTIIGPEAPLAEGVVDAFNDMDLPVVGPTREAAQLETSKIFCMEMLRAARVPIPDFEVFPRTRGVGSALIQRDAIFVVKADGLMQGKGVIITPYPVQASEAVINFHRQGHDVLVQEFLEGQECSFHVLTDGICAVPLLPSRDYKRLCDGDKGPNTGGMGSYAPYKLDYNEVVGIMSEIVYPTLRSMLLRGMRYRGVLYFGLMLTRNGPKVLEINCRFGDPEAQSILSLLESDLFSLLKATTQEGRLQKLEPPLPSQGFAVTVTLAAPGYPENPFLGEPITGLEKTMLGTNPKVYPAGVASRDFEPRTRSGRVAHVTGVGTTLENARSAAYRGANSIHFPGKHMRTDIAADASG